MVDVQIYEDDRMRKREPKNLNSCNSMALSPFQAGTPASPAPASPAPAVQAMGPAELAQIEYACSKFYQGGNPAEHQAAQRQLEAFDQQASPQHCSTLLEKSSSPYCWALAASTLTKLLTKPTCAVLAPERLQIREFGLQFLRTRGLTAPHFVVAELNKLICRIVKMGWFDCNAAEEFIHRDIIARILAQFISAPNSEPGWPAPVILGVQLLQQLVGEMNVSSSPHALAQHRKVMTSFRDKALFSIFDQSLNMINGIKTKQIVITDPGREGALTVGLLDLSHRCLAFDFLGTNSDESTDDTRTAQLPSHWRETIVKPSTMQMFYELYMQIPPPISAKAMSCLVQLASARRTLFSNVQRTDYLRRLVHYVKDCFKSSHGLDNADNYHEFCRLLARLKTNFQLSELVAVEGYAECIDLAATFTIQSLQAWKWASNSIHYLLSLWERLIQSIPYVKSDRPHGLEQYSPRITEAYILSRLGLVEAVLRGETEDPLDDYDGVEIQIKQVAVIARCQFDTTCQYIISVMDPLVAHFSAMLASGPVDPNNPAYKVLDGKLTWLMFVLGAVVGTRTQISPSESYDAIDADLICRALNLMKRLDDRLAAGFPPIGERLNVAILNFLQHFRVSFVGDTVPRHGLMYQKLSETIGVKDESMILDVLVQKIVTNLRYWTTSDTIITKTLKLLSDLCFGYSSLRRLVKSAQVQQILLHHTSQHFPFLDTCADTRHRTTFYTALGRIMSSETTESDVTRFERFLNPIGQVLTMIGQHICNPQGVPAADMPAVKRAMLGVVRDVRGILRSLTSKPSYSVVFEFLYPNFMPVLIKGVELWATDPLISVPILKMMTEFVTNKNSRLQMSTSSQNGILLFRETSQILVKYGEQMGLMGTPDPTRLYSHKYKGVTVCFAMLKSALLGDYVNFGVFDLYKDPALDNAFNIFFRMLVTIPFEDLSNYPKMSKQYYALLVAISRDHVRYLAISDAFFQYLATSALEGIKSFDVQVCTQCCTVLDHILTKTVNGLSKTKPDPDAQKLQAFIMKYVRLFQEILRYLLNLVMFEDCKNQWSVSRPLLGLIVVQYDFYMEMRRQIVVSAPAVKQAQYNQCFENLMTGVEQQLSTKNRDKFTQNLAVFRRDLNTFAKSGPAPGEGAGSAAAAAGNTMAVPAMITSQVASAFGGGTPAAALGLSQQGGTSAAAAFGGGGGGSSAMDS